MPLISSTGNPLSRIWVILDRPYPSDIPKGELMSGGLGYVFTKMLVEAGIPSSDVYYTCRRPDTDTPLGYVSVEQHLNFYKPPLIIVFNEVGTYFLSEMRLKQEDDNWKSKMQKYIGSLLCSSLLQFPHYMMPLYGPDRAVQDWQERNVMTYVDLQKLREELQFWRTNGVLQPLPLRELKYGDMESGEIDSYLERFYHGNKRLSVDIETVYPKGDTAYKGHPGYPITIGIADSRTFGISFDLFRKRPEENRTLWRKLADLFSKSQIIGQNFFNFDALFIQALGFEISLSSISDTLIRSHMLWPELSHKLQFLTRQYTREPYYKDEGRQWNLRDLSFLRRYNTLDVCVTCEVWEEQEKEFQQKLYLL